MIHDLRNDEITESDSSVQFDDILAILRSRSGFLPDFWSAALSLWTANFYEASASAVMTPRYKKRPVMQSKIPVASSHNERIVVFVARLSSHLSFDAEECFS